MARYAGQRSVRDSTDSPVAMCRLILGIMWSQREYVDYGLQRRRTVEALRGPVRSLDSTHPCDAEPILISSALHHGEPTQDACPVCDSDHMVILRYVFGKQLGQYSGRIRSLQELAEMENEYGEFKVCGVEVCPECGWNFMIHSYLLGDGRTRRPPRRQQTVEDIYG